MNPAVYAAAVTAYRHVMAKDPGRRWTWKHTCRVVRRHVEDCVTRVVAEAATDPHKTRYWTDCMVALTRHVLQRGCVPLDEWETWEAGQAWADRPQDPEDPEATPERYGVATYLPAHGHYVWMDGAVLMAAPALRRGGYDPMDAFEVDEDEATPDFVEAARQRLGAV